MFDPSGMVAPGPDPARQVLRDQLAARLRDPVLAGERLLPVSDAFAGLLPARGLRRGSLIAVTGSHALALVAKASQTGSWVTAVGLDDLGIRAAHEFGLVLERLALVPFPGQRWDDVVATMLDGAEIVMVRPPAKTPPATLRRLVARARERQAVLVPLSRWPEADLRLELVRSVWLGLESGHGHLEARQALARANGMPRRGLPGGEGSPRRRRLVDRSPGSASRNR